MAKRVAVKSEGVVTVHADDAGGGNYGTMCGVSVDDNEETGRVVPLPKGKNNLPAKINCRSCIQIIQAAKEYRAHDIDWNFA